MFIIILKWKGLAFLKHRPNFVRLIRFLPSIYEKFHKDYVLSNFNYIYRSLAYNWKYIPIQSISSLNHIYPAPIFSLKDSIPPVLDDLCIWFAK